MEYTQSAQPEFDPAPRRPEAAIATLGTRALIELNKILSRDNELLGTNRPWRQVVAMEQSRRTRSLKSLQDYRPSRPECPGYEAEKGPASYLDLVRKSNIAAGITPQEIGKGMPETALIGPLVQSTDISQGDYTHELTDEDIYVSLTANVRGIILGPHSSANASYEHAKYEAIRLHVPEASAADAKRLKYQTQLLKFKKGDIEAMQITIEDVPYRLAVPDFYQLGRKHQDEILSAIAAEWLETCAFIGTIDAGILARYIHPSQMPLAYCSLAELQQATEQSTPQEAKEICRVFLQHPHEFKTKLQDARETAARNVKIATRLAQAARKGEPQDKPVSVQNVHRGGTAAPYNLEALRTPKNRNTIQQLLADPDINPAVLDAKAGEAVLITQADQILPASKFDLLVDKHIELIGRAAWENMEGKCPSGLRLISWGTLDMGALLRGKFHGNLRNLKITRSPVTEADLKKLNTHFIHAPLSDEVLRLLIEAEMKPTGKKPEQVFASLILLIRKAEPGVRSQDTLRKLKTGMRTTGPETAHMLQMEAKAIGRAVESTARSTPLRAGLPGLGRKS